MEQINDFQKKYFRTFYGNVWVREDDHEKNCEIKVTSPFTYKTAEAALSEKCVYVFEKRCGHIVLVVYPENMEVVSDNDIGFIYWKDWKQYSMSIESDVSGKYVPLTESWDELFNVAFCPDDFRLIIEELGYNIFSYENI